MLNTTSTLQINNSGDELDLSIRIALKRAADVVLKAYGKESFDLSLVTTKSNYEIAFPLFVSKCVLNCAEHLDEEYLVNAYNSYMANNDLMTSKQFEKFTQCNIYPYQQYRKVYRRGVRIGIGIFLIFLHISKAITLPANFVWPIQRQKGYSRLSRCDSTICADSELLCYIRSIETDVAVAQDGVLDAIGAVKGRLDWLRSFGTKLILAGGWSSPEDVTYDDLLKLKLAEGSKQTVVSVHRTLIHILKHKFADRMSVSVDDWDSILIAIAEMNPKEVTSANIRPEGGLASIYRGVVELQPSAATPKRMASKLTLPNLRFDVRKNSTLWMELYDIYFERYPRESYSAPIRAIGILNLYLFYYLPYWFEENPSTSLKFPAAPQDLVRSVFISRLTKTCSPMPITLMEFMHDRFVFSGISESSFYADVKQLEVFFKFLVDHAEELPGCVGFKQPLSKLDYPEVSRTLGTDKSPIPRRLFIPFLNFVECIREYVNTINLKIISGKISPRHLYEIRKFTTFIDAKFVCENFGIELPRFDVEGKEVKVNFVPLVASSGWYLIKSGKRVKLLRPHALNQIIVALYTGLRHNHIQWLDLDKFDTSVVSNGSDYCALYVNTDKVSKKPWQPYVNKRVIEILRSQREWRELIGEPSFDVEHFYNSNRKTSYPKFRPLFSYFPDSGKPHPDCEYEDAWSSLLLCFQSLMPDFPMDENTGKVIVKLKPPHVYFHDLNEKEKLAKYKNEEYLCRLVARTKITPHSTRVTVVSHLISFLPAELIGKHVTGQSPATVFHYVAVEGGDLDALRVAQARDMQQRAYESKISGFLQGDTSVDESFIKADTVNSRLAKSAKIDLTQTIARYGCISIDYRDDEGDGIDVLKERGIEQAAFNKTEICPYGNQCPQDVIKNLRGLRRCSLCPYAVRSIDHLPALIAREKFTAELMTELMEKIDGGSGDFTEEELDALEIERQRLGEEYAGWRLCIEALEVQRLRVLAGEDSRTWVVEKPEIIEQDLKRIIVPTGVSNYLISRLQEAVQYPGFQSPLIKAQFDLLRRRVLATDARRISEAFSTRVPVNPAAECAGVLRSFLSAHELSMGDIHELLTTDKHMKSIPKIKGEMRLVSDGHLNEKE